MDEALREFRLHHDVSRRSRRQSDYFEVVSLLVATDDLLSVRSRSHVTHSYIPVPPFLLGRVRSVTSACMTDYPSMRRVHGHVISFNFG